MYHVDIPAVGHLSPEEIRRQIEAVCASHSFRHRESFRKLLTYLADKTLDGSADALKEYSVGIELFGKPESYDPREDATVRVQISKLRQKLEEYYLGEGKNDPVVIELPRRQLALVFHPRHVARQSLVALPTPVFPEEQAKGVLRRWPVAGRSCRTAGSRVSDREVRRAWIRERAEGETSFL
jgi:hypothetical protein